MTMAEFTAVIDRRVAWRVMFKVAVAIIGGCLTIFTIAMGPVLWTYGNVETNRKDNARLEQQFNELTRTVGALQIGVAEMRSEIKLMKGEQARGTEEILRRLEPPARAAVAPPRTATRRATQ